MENLTIEIAKEFLTSRGYYTECLFHRKMVQNKYNVSNQTADLILIDVVEMDGIWERIYDGINLLCEANYYKPLTEITEFDVLEMSREEVINYLCWYDKNGVYRDEQCEDEGISPLTLEAAKEFAIRFIIGNGGESEEYGDPTENQHFLYQLMREVKKSKEEEEKKAATEIYYLFRCDDVNRPSILKETDKAYPLTDFNIVYEIKSALDLMGINYDLLIEVFDNIKCEVVSNDYIVTNNHKN